MLSRQSNILLMILNCIIEVSQSHLKTLTKKLKGNWFKMQILKPALGGL